MNKLHYGILIVAIVFQYNTLQAQSFNFGFKGSVNASYFHGDYIYAGEDITLAPEAKLSGRFSAGGLMRYNLTEVTSIQTEVLYTTRGVRFSEVVTIRNQKFSFKGDLALAYIEIPVLLRFSTGLRDRGPTFVQEPGFTFNAYTGGSVGYKTNAKFTGRLAGDIFGIDMYERFENRVWDQFADTDVSFIIGAGFEYGIRYRFTFDIRYIINVMDIGNDSHFTDDIRNGMVAVFIGGVF